MGNLLEIKKISEEAYEFLRKFDPSEYIDGKYNLKNGVYVNIESYETKKRDDAKYESHRKYIDIQYMISGLEIISVAPVNELEVLTPYDLEKDITFYKNQDRGENYILSSGNYFVFKPEDAHMPCLSVDQISINRKAVFKIPV